MYDVVVRLLLAVVLAGSLGLERERKGRAAGLRTHVLVCLGSTLAMLVSDYLAADWNHSGAPVWLDRGRIAAGILTGIGFLGAGTIINVRGAQRGLTTAAMIWFVAALGIAIGTGYLMIAAVATIFALATVICLERIERILPSTRHFSLDIRKSGGLDRMDEIEWTIREMGFFVTASRYKVSSESTEANLTFEMKGTSKTSIVKLIQALQGRFESIQSIACER